jgi:hypothetical protein
MRREKRKERCDEAGLGLYKILKLRLSRPETPPLALASWIKRFS